MAQIADVLSSLARVRAKHDGTVAQTGTVSSVDEGTIGIDTGKNTLHLIGLDDNGASARRSLAAGRSTAYECAAVPDWYRGRHGDALCGPRAAWTRS
jgi:hypothetical protein